MPREHETDLFFSSSRNQNPYNNGGGHGGPMMGGPMQAPGWGMQQPPQAFYPNQYGGGMQPGPGGPPGAMGGMGGGMPGGMAGGMGGGMNSSLNQFTDPNNTTVFVGGLSGYVTEDELRSFFQGFGEITYVKIPPGKGCGFVQFVHRHAAEMAINQMQGYPIGNSRVRLSWGRSQNNSGVGTPYRPAPPPPHYSGGPPGPYNPAQFGGGFGNQQPPPGPIVVSPLAPIVPLSSSFSLALHIPPFSRPFSSDSSSSKPRSDLYLPMPFFRIDKVFRRLGVTAGSGKPQGSCSFLRSDIWGLRFAVL